ncbi:hypothetical protein [Winogradskyella bathintestinalis]|uniref:DUF4382 domain-containing protein n=1 Tax=Winogradskyella bathintestinalis TaxID=3035208 RepID=A0ABT7ZT64_9FLAO|nr:hypothetical protein [Winogradskyella bathintestinalis]MDN3492146.1 hypothetical protein [Winogradskyella bathintestinalis]
MKHIKRFAFAILVILSVSCSSDDDSSSSQNENNITVGASVYEMKTAMVEPSIGNKIYLNITNKKEDEITAAINGTTLNNVDMFSARINALDLTPNITYNLSEISSLEFVVDGEFIGADFENGLSQFYLGDGTSDLRVVDGSITVLDYAMETISLSFSFTRADGEEITGIYKGAYLYQTSNDE